MNDLANAALAPALLTVPGIDNSGPGHWQTIWEREDAACRRVHLGAWSAPGREAWVSRLNCAIAAATRPAILIAHSLGCHARQQYAPIDPRLRPFGPVVRKRLAFPALLVASRNDPYASYGHARRMARIWGARMVDAGPMGHINAASGLRDWPYGKYLVQRLIAAVTPPPRPLLEAGALATLLGQGEAPRSPR